MKDTLNIMVLGNGTTGEWLNLKKIYIDAGAEIRKLITEKFISENFGLNQVVLQPKINCIYLVNMPDSAHAIIESVTSDIIVTLNGWDENKLAMMCIFNVQHGYEGRLILQLTKDKVEEIFTLEKFTYVSSLAFANPQNKDPMRLLKGTIDIGSLTQGDNIVDIGGGLKLNVRKEKKKKKK